MLDKKIFLTRVTTAIIFGAIVIFLLNFSRDTVFVFLAIVSFATSYEYIKIKKSKSYSKFNQIIAPLLFGSGPLIIEHFSSVFNKVGFFILLVASLVFSVYLMFNLFTKKKSVTKNDFLMHFKLLFYIGIPFLLMGYLFLTPNDSFTIIIFILILMIWTNDTFAYLTGSLFGKNKLMPSVSPGKTIEGFVGGGMFTIIVSYLLFLYYGTYPVLFYVILAFIVWIFGTIGDLIESLLKRTYGIKYCGKIMPGHGGFLDRFDSFIFTIPFLVLLAYLFA